MRFLSRSLPIILALILACAAFVQSDGFPMPPAGISAEKYDQFSGVLTISIEENLELTFPQLRRWITEITNLFEKRNRGVYLSFARNGQSADIVLRAPGFSADTAALSIGEYDLMPAFSASDYAVPIAAGGYLLGINGEIPSSLDQLSESSVGYSEKFSPIWVALCEQFSPESTQKRMISTPDIGLIAVETPEPTTIPRTGTQILRQNLAEGDPDELFDAFLAGEILALPLNQNQVAKIRDRQADGLYPKIQFRNAAAFTDSIVYATVNASLRDDADARADACREFIEYLLSEDAQRRTAKYNMFPTAMVAPAYEGISGMSEIENALHRSDCVTQGPHAPPITIDFDAFLDGRISARELMRELRNRQ